jgi:hypothetical protein
VDKFQEFVEDDEDDTLLFERLQQNALENCPNPGRIGCPPHHVLAGFVATPRKFTVADLNDLHIFQCAECTRELMGLRQHREMQLRRRTILPWWTLPLSVGHVIAVCIAFAVLALTVAIVRNQMLRSQSSQSVAEAGIQKTVDLSTDGVLRGITETEQGRPIVLVRTRTNLHLILPYYSAGGAYRVMLVGQRNLESSVAAADGFAVAVGSHTELNVILNLRQIATGNYYLATIAGKDKMPSFYAVHVE